MILEHCGEPAEKVVFTGCIHWECFHSPRNSNLLLTTSKTLASQGQESTWLGSVPTWNQRAGMFRGAKEQ